MRTLLIPSVVAVLLASTPFEAAGQARSHAQFRSTPDTLRHRFGPFHRSPLAMRSRPFSDRIGPAGGQAFGGRRFESPAAHMAWHRAPFVGQAPAFSVQRDLHWAQNAADAANVPGSGRGAVRWQRDGDVWRRAPVAFTNGVPDHFFFRRREWEKAGIGVWPWILGWGSLAEPSGTEQVGMVCKTPTSFCYLESLSLVGDACSCPSSDGIAGVVVP
jgi:hypothetical protein